MKTHIGIFTANESMKNILSVEAQMRELCDITYLPYSSTVELINLYLEHAGKFDGLLFSGAFPHDYISKNIGGIGKPTKYLDLADRDIYLAFARLFAQKPTIDFSRVAFEASTMETLRGENNRYLEEIFWPKPIPDFHLLTDLSFYTQNLNTMYEAVLKRYRDCWYSGTVDLFMTRLTNIAKKLEEEQIPFLLIQPGRETIMDCFKELLNDIKKEQLENALTGCCIIQIAHEGSTEKEQTLLRQTLERFNSEQNMVFVLRQNGDVYEAVTSKSAVRRMTSNYTTCLLTSYLYEMLPFSTYIGWGMGYDIVTAHQNALRAIRESAGDPQRYTYMLNENQEMVGPLCGDRTISYQLKPSARTNHIAKILGISAINLEKMISLQEKRNMTEFSASDLVFYLDVTPRSATRILKKLVDYGAASKVDSVNLNGRGRPAAIYEIDFDKIRLE